MALQIIGTLYLLRIIYILYKYLFYILYTWRKISTITLVNLYIYIFSQFKLLLSSSCIYKIVCRLHNILYILINFKISKNDKISRIIDHSTFSRGCFERRSTVDCTENYYLLLLPERKWHVWKSAANSLVNTSQPGEWNHRLLYY